MPPPAAYVAQQMIKAYGQRLHDQSLCLTTPVPNLVNPSEIQLQKSLNSFLTAYEPRVFKNGLYAHQATILQALKAKKIPDIVMTTATGSGKSLAFWAWVFEHLAHNPKATAIATFPTQALLWGQAKRLANMSDPPSLVRYKGLKDVCFAGTIKLQGCGEIPWSVWYGQGCEYMTVHIKHPAFAKARIRVSTLDKVHWSLMQETQVDFLRRLACIVVDEAHSWHGLTGASVRAMFDRLHLSMDMLQRKHPAFFLASATLAEPTTFAESLTGIPAASFLEVNDLGVAKASLVKTELVPQLISQPAEPGLLRRYVLLMKPNPDPLSAKSVLGNPNHLGSEANALCFVQSKFVGHLLRDNLSGVLKDWDVVAYDADLSPQDRRQVEAELFQASGRPKVVIGTSALELGIDLPTLDVVVMDDLPPRRCDLMQRLGRVGRSSERPGLAILCLGYSPSDERLIEDPIQAVALNNMKPLPLPLHLDTIRLRAISAAFEEWRWRIRRREVTWANFNDALQKYFQWSPTIDELKQRCREVLGDMVDIDEGNWYYKGFRASASQGKRCLYLENTKTVVAMIDDMAIFRDAHPEGVYLGHRSACYRIKRYKSKGKWDVATWNGPKGIVLGKYMKGLERIEVSEEQPTIATRGRWIDSFTLDEAKEPPHNCIPPPNGQLTFGIFTFIRKFDGYLEIDLRGRKKARSVSLTEVAQRFGEAVGGGEEFPFLHNFSYRTKGWKWVITRVLNQTTRETLAPILGPLVEGFFCDAVECSHNDLQVTFDAQAGELRVVDATPGGNGLSEALLTNARVKSAWDTAIKQIKTYGGKSPQFFHRYLAEECQVDSNVTVGEVLNAISHMARAW